MAHTHSYEQGANGIGRLSAKTDPTGSTSCVDDIYRRVVSDTRSIGGHSYTTAYSYDSAGAAHRTDFAQRTHLEQHREQLQLE